MKPNFCEIQSQFWLDAPFRPGYKALYGVVFCATIQVMKMENCDTLTDMNAEINKYAKVGRDILNESLKWLDSQDFLHYESKINQNNASIISTFSGYLIQSGGSEASVTRTEPGSQAAVNRAVSEELPHVHARPRGKGLTTGVEDNSLIESNSILLRSKKDENENEEEPNQVPDFVQRERDNARQYLKPTPPIPQEPEWCTVNSTSYSKKSFKDLLLNEIYPEQSIRETLKMKYHLPDFIRAIDDFIENRAHCEAFTTKRYVTITFNAYMTDVVSGKTSPKVVPMPLAGPEPTPEMNWGTYEFK